jgi:ATP-binding cassette subfamily B protein
MWSKIKWFWKYYRKHTYVLMVLLVLTPLQAAVQVSVPRMIEFTIDYVKTGEVPDNSAAVWISSVGDSIGISTAVIFALSLMLIGLVASILYAFMQSHRAWMNLKLEWLFRQSAFESVTEKGPDFFNKFRVGDMVTRMTDDVAEKLSWFACSGIFRLYEALLFVAFTITMMLLIDPILTLWTVGPLPILILIFFKSASILDKRYDHLQTRISRQNDVVEACFAGVRVVKAYVQEKAQKLKFKKAADDRRDAEISTVKATTIVDSLYMYIWQFGIIIVLLSGGYMVINSNLSLGKLVAFIYYVVYLVFPMFDIGQFLVKSRQSAVSIDRLNELESMPPMVEDTGNIACDGDTKGHIIFENISLKLPGSERKILDNISFEVKPGQTVALVGRVGSGKSWISTMIPRVVDPTDGKIMLDGEDLRNYRLNDLRRVVGYVPQEPVLFSESVKENIAFGRENLSKDDIDRSIGLSQLKKEIDNFPEGAETQIGTRGVSISGGQKQRLSLARALSGNPKILILDDCTSALDSRTENALWDSLREIMPDMTIILVTHRPDVLEAADNIIVLDDGKIIEAGKHYELMSSNGVYAKIYKRYQLEEEVNSVA